MKIIREYFEQHRDIIVTLGLALLADRYFFDGAFTEKIKAIVNGLLLKAERKLDDKVDEKVGK